MFLLHKFGRHGDAGIIHLYRLTDTFSCAIGAKGRICRYEISATCHRLCKKHECRAQQLHILSDKNNAYRIGFHG